jgi:predicted hydrolase (HD superfamily)
MKLTCEEAWKHLCDWTRTDSLLKHARALEIVMRKAAHHYGDDKSEEDEWAVAGILHDADYEQWPEEHPRRIVAWLEERGEHRIAHAISAHYTKWGVAYETRLDQCLLACDELTGFVVACSLVRPEGIGTLTSQSVRKKLKDKAFAAKVDRQEIAAGVELLGIDLDGHIRFIIESLKPYAKELGIEGRTQKP